MDEYMLVIVRRLAQSLGELEKEVEEKTQRWHELGGPGEELRRFGQKVAALKGRLEMF